MAELILESDEAQDWESDEAFAEADESTEDIGEAARRRRRVPAARGVGGMTVRRADGGQTKLSFAAPLATASETNRVKGELEKRLQQLETRLRTQQKSGVSATGLAFLVVGGGLTFWGVGKTLEAGSGWNGWAKDGSTEGAALFSAGQLAITGSTLAVTGVYSRSWLHIMADVFATGQLAAYAFGSWYTPSNGKNVTVDNVIADADLDGDYPGVLQTMKPYAFAVTHDTHKMVQVIPYGKLNTYRTVD